MAKGVVDGFEVVQINEDHRVTAVVGFFLDVFQKSPVVGQLGEGVFAEQCLEFSLSFADGRSVLEIASRCVEIVNGTAAAAEDEEEFVEIVEEIVVSVVSTPFLSGGANRRLGCSIAASGSREKNIAGRMSRDLRLPDPSTTWIGRIIALIASWAHNLLARASPGLKAWRTMMI